MDTSSDIQALVERNKQRSQLSVPEAHAAALRKFEEASAKLKPAEPKQVVAELAACLTLVAPGGMSADDRTEWIKVARMTVGDIPAEPFHSACKAARKSCRFASEIVPAIVREAQERTVWIRMAANYAHDDLKALERRALPPPERVTADEMKKILADVAAERKSPVQ